MAPLVVTVGRLHRDLGCEDGIQGGKAQGTLRQQGPSTGNCPKNKLSVKILHRIFEQLGERVVS